MGNVEKMKSLLNIGQEWYYQFTEGNLRLERLDPSGAHLAIAVFKGFEGEGEGSIDLQKLVAAIKGARNFSIRQEDAFLVVQTRTRTTKLITADFSEVKVKQMPKADIKGSVEVELKDLLSELKVVLDFRGKDNRGVLLEGAEGKLWLKLTKANGESVSGYVRTKGLLVDEGTYDPALLSSAASLGGVGVLKFGKDVPLFLDIEEPDFAFSYVLAPRVDNA